MPRIIAYNVYLSEEHNRMTVVQIHPDSESLEFHMEVGAPVFRGFGDLLTLLSIDVYGGPGEKLLGQLRSKAQMLGSAAVRVHPLRAGFSRFAAQGRGQLP